MKRPVAKDHPDRESRQEPGSTQQPRQPRLLHLLLALGETSSPYNEHCLPMADERTITVCTFFSPTIRTASGIRVFPGNGSLRGFVRALRTSLSAGPYDAVHAHSPHVAFLYLLVTLFRSKEDLPPSVFTVHTSFPNSKLRNRLLMLPVFALFGTVVACGQASAESFPRLFRWLVGNRLCVVPNSVDLDRVDRVLRTLPRRADNDPFTVVSVGRLIALKRPQTIWAAFHRIGDDSACLRFFGDGPLGAEIRARSEAAGMANLVRLEGFVPREQVYEHLARADLFVSASTVEGLPVSVLEAMACHCPVLLSDIPPHVEIAQEAEFVPLVSPDDVDGFARGIQSFLQMSAAERERIGEQCRRLVEEHFSLNAMQQRYLDIYRR